MSSDTYLAARIRAVADNPQLGDHIAARLELLALAVQVQRMEVVLDDVVGAAHADEVRDRP